MNIKGVIFDFNGTLFKDSEYHIAAWQKISQMLTHSPMSREEILQKTQGVCNAITIDRLTQGRCSKEENQAWSRKKEALYRQLVVQDRTKAALVPGAVELFETLRDHGIPFVIASASIEENIDFFFDFFQLDRWFERKQTIYDDGSYPDKGAMFEAALKILGCNRQAVLIFEDSDKGLDCAEAAGFSRICMLEEDSQRVWTLLQRPSVCACLPDLSEAVCWFNETKNPCAKMKRNIE